MMGKPFTGRTLLGFDNTKQTFNSVWGSDTQTSMFTSEGKGDSGNKVITLEGKASCPATGRKDIPMKTVLRVISPDKHVLNVRRKPGAERQDDGDYLHPAVRVSDSASTAADAVAVLDF